MFTEVEFIVDVDNAIVVVKNAIVVQGITVLKNNIVVEDILVLNGSIKVDCSVVC